MGTLTLTEFQEELLTYFGNRDDVSSERLTRVLNLAQTRVARVRDWKEMRISTAFTIAYTGTVATDAFTAFSTIWPSGRQPKHIFTVRLFDGTSSIRLRRETPRLRDEFDAYPLANSVNKPLTYVEWNQQFEWDPVPNQAYSASVRALMWPTAFSTASMSATSDLNEKDDLILALAVNRMARMFKQHDLADKMFGEYKDLLNDAIQADNTRPDNDPVPNRKHAGRVPFSGSAHLDPFVKRID